MRYAIQVNGAPGTSRAAYHADQFIRAAIGKGHTVILVFFYYEGVINGLTPDARGGSVPAADLAWSKLAARYDLDLCLCVAAAERRGWTPEEPGSGGLLPGFRVGGLGQWVDACARAERCLVFVA